jgi:hypothetical protein
MLTYFCWFPRCFYTKIFVSGSWLAWYLHYEMHYVWCSSWLTFSAFITSYWSTADIGMEPLAEGTVDVALKCVLADRKGGFRICRKGWGDSFYYFSFRSLVKNRSVFLSGGELWGKDSLLKHWGRCTRVRDKSNGVKWLERDVGGARGGDEWCHWQNFPLMSSLEGGEGGLNRKGSW